MANSQELEHRVFAVVEEAVRELNQDLQYDNLERPGRDTALWGAADGIDSLSLVNLAVGLEERVRTEFGGDVSLTDADALATATSPFRTVGALVDYIVASLPKGAAE